MRTLIYTLLLGFLYPGATLRGMLDDIRIILASSPDLTSEQIAQHKLSILENAHPHCKDLLKQAWHLRQAAEHADMEGPHRAECHRKIAGIIHHLSSYLEDAQKELLKKYSELQGILNTLEGDQGKITCNDERSALLHCCNTFF